MPTKINLKSKKVVDSLKKVNNQYRPIIMGEIARYLDNVRKNAAKEIIPNTTGILNPYRAAKRQRSVMGRLTSRTGKTVWALKEKTNPPGTNFIGGRYRLQKTTALFKEVITRVRTQRFEKYRGQIRFDFKPHGRLTSEGQKGNPSLRMPKEDAKTFWFRMLWDTRGLKGSGKRPFITPAAKKTMSRLKYLTQRRLDELMRII